MLFVSFIVE